MNLLILRSYVLLIRVDAMLKLHGFKKLHDSLQDLPTREIVKSERILCERLCHAINLACVLYPRTVLCLQRSAATIFLMRRYGWPAELVTGCSIGTFENHAWVELDRQVVNDKPYIHEIYQVLDRC